MQRAKRGSIKASGEREEESRTTTRNKDTQGQEHDKGSKPGGEGCSSQTVRVQLTDSAGAAY